MYNMISTRQLTPKGDRAIRDLAQHYGVSVEAVRTLLFAVSAGGGTLAQFDHPELGGSGRPGSAGSLQSHEDILKTLERIGDLHQKGILSDDEFKSKKAELLSRL